MATIRHVRPDDWEAFKLLRTEAVRLHPDAFGATIESELAKTDAQWQQRVAAGALGGNETIFVADNGAQLVGMAGIYRETGKTSHIGNIWGVYVQADYRGRDLGVALLQEAIAWARRKPELRKLKLQVNACATPAFKLYRSCGFTEAGRLSDELCVDGECYDMILMELFL
jgi:ribosomal protein S18 acetylase RimI-like enzyme